jgi:hypothetical protein
VGGNLTVSKGDVMNKFKRLTSVAVLLLAVFTAGCGGNNTQSTPQPNPQPNPPQPITYTVSFNADGGSPTPASQSIQLTKSKEAYA